MSFWSAHNPMATIREPVEAVAHEEVLRDVRARAERYLDLMATRAQCSRVQPKPAFVVSTVLGYFLPLLEVVFAKERQAEGCGSRHDRDTTSRLFVAVLAIRDVAVHVGHGRERHLDGRVWVAADVSR